jgi:hypothetical protein
MSLRRLYLLLLAFCCVGMLFEALIAGPSEVVELPSEAVPSSWAPRSQRPRPEGFQQEFTREQNARA